ncbi:MAG: hypothetical protein ACI4XL_01755 [Bacillus sp. (in: firmicutes)]
MKNCAFASLFNPRAPVAPPTTATAITEGTIVDFTVPGPSNCAITSVQNDSITVLESGVYRITSGISLIGTAPTTAEILEGEATVGLRINGEVVVNSIIEVDFADIVTIGTRTATARVAGSIDLFLNAGDVVQLEIITVPDRTDALVNYGKASLIVTELFDLPFEPFNVRFGQIPGFVFEETI